MATRIRWRLEKLERATGTNGPRPCPECGYTPGNRKYVPVTVTFSRWGETPPDPGPTHCPTCGRQRVFTFAPTRAA